MQMALVGLGIRGIHFIYKGTNMNFDCADIKNLDDLEKMITDLNYKVFENYDNDSGIYESEYMGNLFSFETDGHCIHVRFAGVIIWDSENDEREYVFENTPNERREDLIPFILKQSKELLSEALNKITSCL